MLYPAIPQYPALPPFVLVPELPALAVGDDFVIAVRMQGPDCARGERVVIEHAQCAEVRVFRIVVLVKGEVPPPVECAVLYLAV